jgi:hypothetical protein
VHEYAQTNLQLYAQLDRAGWTEPQLALAARAYDLALHVCGASFRPNGKPFLCHLVGTASILASWPATTDEVICGLVHSVYTHGVFSDPKRGVTDAKRTVVRDAIGETEALVTDYTELAWNIAAAAAWAAKEDPPSSGERSAVRVRLANELEDHLDLGLLYARKTKVTEPVRPGDPLLVLAERFVSRKFSHELEAAISANEEGSVASSLVREDVRSFRVA